MLRCALYYKTITIKVCALSLVDSLSHRLSFDEGRSWSKYTFTSTPLFVDGVLGEPGEDTLIMT